MHLFKKTGAGPCLRGPFVDAQMGFVLAGGGPFASILRLDAPKVKFPPQVIQLVFLNIVVSDFLFYSFGLLGESVPCKVRRSRINQNHILLPKQLNHSMTDSSSHSNYLSHYDCCNWSAESSLNLLTGPYHTSGQEEERVPCIFSCGSVQVNYLRQR